MSSIEFTCAFSRTIAELLYLIAVIVFASDSGYHFDHYSCQKHVKYSDCKNIFERTQVPFHAALLTTVKGFAYLLAVGSASTDRTFCTVVVV